MASAIRTFDLGYDDADPLAFARLVKALFPSWEKVEVERMTGGVNNTLFRVRKEDRDSDNQEAVDEAALIRIYGGSSGILVDREQELNCHILLQMHGLAPRIIGRFHNGYAYGFVPGKVCSPVEVAREPVWRGIAERTLPTSTEEETAKQNELIAEGGLLQALFSKNHVRDMPESVRRQFLLQYMSAYNKLCKPDGKIRDIDELCAEVDKFRGVPGFFWGIGALIQAQVSKMDFDFTKYANLRIAEYMDWKAEMSGSREQSGREKPLREQQWAKE
ncbi:hypothetical protein BKA61DRAFT_571303 [Leptodontidium sp. MPI-SDFR-AT-0119]|nr:hypothetical protein BKA61DRAFT_571303 [Leptodontidium sp. MPI-SDFR-AT-0119]